MEFVSSWAGQLRPLPNPRQDCTGRVIIVTGANTGLGLEAARHFVRLNAAKVILACRNKEKAEKAKLNIENSTGRFGVVEAWRLDLCSFASVREFAARAARLDRLDILVNNASIMANEWEMFEGHESQMTVNVISTLLLSLLILPTLRRSGKQYGIVPRIVTVSSDAANMAAPRELSVAPIMPGLDQKRGFNGVERYFNTKLLQLMMVRKLAAAVDASGKGHVVINGLNPGLCKTNLFDNMGSGVSLSVTITRLLIGRTPEMGSRTLMSAAFAGEETHGGWMTNCKRYSAPFMMRGAKGKTLTDQVWGELLVLIEEIEPGITDAI